MPVGKPGCDPRRHGDPRLSGKCEAGGTIGHPTAHELTAGGGTGQPLCVPPAPPLNLFSPQNQSSKSSPWPPGVTQNLKGKCQAQP